MPLRQKIHPAIAYLLLSLFLAGSAALGLFATFLKMERVNRRACFANQHAIDGAIEMYEVDHGITVTALDEELWTRLKTKGYLCCPDPPPADPGQGKGSGKNYVLLKGKVCCLHHGYAKHSSKEDRRSFPASLAAAGSTFFRWLENWPPPLPAIFLLVSLLFLMAWSLTLRRLLLSHSAQGKQKRQSGIFGTRGIAALPSKPEHRASHFHSSRSSDSFHPDE